MDKVEVWLSWQNNKERFQLPITPPKFGVKTSNQNEKVNINAVGMIKLIGKSDLKELTISSFFPAHEYSFIDSKTLLSPYEYVEIIEGWRLSEKPIRVIFTNTPINLPMSIESFDFFEEDGTGDVYFELDLEEYIFINKTKRQVKKSVRTTQKKNKTYTYTTQPNDTLYKIAKIEYGQGKEWPRIYNYGNNKKIIGKNPNILKVGIKITIPRK